MAASAAPALASPSGVSRYRCRRVVSTPVVQPASYPVAYPASQPFPAYQNPFANHTP